MSEHYSKSTVAAEAWCRKCQKYTQHSVFDGRIGACQACVKRLADAPKVAPPAKQESLF